MKKFSNLLLLSNFGSIGLAHYCGESMKKFSNLLLSSYFGSIGLALILRLLIFFDVSL